MVDKFKSLVEKFKKTWWIGLIIYVVIAIFILPPMIFANFNIKTKIINQYNILDFPILFKAGTKETVSKLTEIWQYDTTKIPEEDKWNGMVEISGSKYIFKSYLNTLIILFAIYVIILAKSYEEKNEYEGIEHGSSDWADKSEIYTKFSPKEGTIIAEKIYINMDQKTKGNKNLLVVGGSGSGKTAGFVKPNVKQNLGSYVFTDPKGEIFDYSAKYFESQGYDIKVLNLKNPKNSDGYNPILNISNDIDLDIVARTIVLGQQEGSGTDDPYFVDNAQVLLKSFIRFLKQATPKEEQNLASCANLVRNTVSPETANVLRKIMQDFPEDNLARKDFESVSIATDKAFSSIASTLQSLLSKFETPDIAALTSTNTINFADIGRKKTALYVISSDTNSTFDFLLTIFFSQMLDKLYEEADNNGGALNIPVVFFLDEFANIGKIPDFDRKIATSRSRRISFNVILQSLEQLENIYGTTYETIVGNCDTHLFLGSASSKTLEYFSKALGEKTIKISHKNKEGEEDLNKDQKLGRYLMTPDEIRRIPYNECLIFASGIKPIKAKKYFFFEHKDSKVPDKYYTDNTSYTVDRGYWNAFSLNTYKNEAKKRSMNKIIQGDLSQNSNVNFVNLNQSGNKTSTNIEDSKEKIKAEENKKIEIDASKNSNQNRQLNQTQYTNINLKNNISNKLNIGEENKKINEKNNEKELGNNIETNNSTSKLKFNLNLENENENEKDIIDKEENNSENKEIENKEIKNKNLEKLPEDHINNFFLKKAEESIKEERNVNFKEKSKIDNSFKENLNTNLKRNKYSDENEASELQGDSGLNAKTDSKEEINRKKKITGLKDLNKEFLIKKVDKSTEEKEIEKNLEEKFQKLFGDMNREKE